MTRLFNRLLLGLIVIFALPFYWLMLDNRPGDTRPRPISMSQLRNLAETGEGAAPTAISYEQVARNLRSRNMRAAGAGIRLERHFAQVFMLQIPDSRPIIIDSGMTALQARQSGYGTYFASAQKNVENALNEAGIVVTLAAGAKHEGGLTRLRKRASTGNAPTRILAAGTDSGSTSPFAISRGVVAIPATGLPDNRRLIYVRKQDGSEFLFAGDTSQTYRNWMHLRAPARLVTDFQRKQDRRAIFEWLKTIRKLQVEAPDMTIIPGDQLPGGGRLRHGFPGDADGP